MPLTSPNGLATLHALRAEYEPWLLDCYVPPSEFPLMVGPRSTLIFGETGSGTSALYLALAHAWTKSDTENSWLLVRWPLNVLADRVQNLTGSMLASRQQAQVFDVVARVLLERLARQPALWRNAPDWTRATLAWFVSRYLQSSLGIYVASLIDEQLIAEPDVLREIAAFERTELLAPNAPPVSVIAELTRALITTGLSGHSNHREDVEPWWEMYANELSGSLFAFCPRWRCSSILPLSTRCCCQLRWRRISCVPAV